MIKMEDIKATGPEYAAARLHSEGMGQESNPYQDEDKRLEFAKEMARLEQEEFKQLMGWAV